MIETRILQGKKVAEAIKSDISEEIRELRKSGLIPGLAAILVGENPASKVYVGSKTRTCQELEMHSKTFELSSETRNFKGSEGKFLLLNEPFCNIFERQEKI